MHYWFNSYGDFAEWVDFCLLDKVVKLVAGGSVIKGAYPVERKIQIKLGKKLPKHFWNWELIYCSYLHLPGSEAWRWLVHFCISKAALDPDNIDPDNIIPDNMDTDNIDPDNS